MIVKYGNFYISWFNISNCEFGVDTISNAFRFNGEDQAHKVMRDLGLKNYYLARA